MDFDKDSKQHKPLEKISTKYIIPLILIFASFSIYSYNLEGQTWHGDETLYNAAGTVYFDLLKNGDLLNPCWNALGECDSLHRLDWGWPPRDGHVRTLLIGFGRDLVGDPVKNTYEWSCYFSWLSPKDCWNKEYTPSPSELVSGRILSPIFGSLSVMLVYFIGKSLFNRFTGLSFALTLLIYGIWVWNSRAAMTEVYAGFFTFLTILLLIYAVKTKSNINYKYLILSSLVFGISINAKLNSAELIVLFLAIIVFRKSFGKKLDFGLLLKRKELFSTIFIILIFFSGTTMALFVSNPYYYPDPINQLLEMGRGEKELSDAKIVLLTYPSIENDHLFRTLATFHTTLIPYFVPYYEAESSEESYHDLALDETFTISSVPLSIFFFIGLFYLISKIRARSINCSEFLILIWFTSLFVLVVLTVREFNMERYYLPLMIPIMLIASYGMWNLLGKIQNKKEKFLLFFSFIFCHSLFTLTFWEHIYFSPGVFQFNPLPFTMQNSFEEPIIQWSSIGFVILLITLLFKNRKNKNENFLKTQGELL